jgi:hypothetical protein
VSKRQAAPNLHKRIRISFKTHGSGPGIIAIEEGLPAEASARRSPISEECKDARTACFGPANFPHPPDVLVRRKSGPERPPLVA